jgi:DNA-binding transcriptional LysR family regulator
MDIRQLELFLAVMEHSSITRAAQKVNLSPGAISLQMHNLAASLRADLFVKSGKRLVPTNAARHLEAQARIVLSQMRQIERGFANDPSADFRPFHFACGATTLIHRLGKPLRLVRRQFPNTTIQVTVSSTEEMVAGLLDHRFDLALISLPFASGSLTVMPLFDEELQVLRPSAKAVRGSRILTIEPAELERDPFLLYPKRSNMRAMIDKFFEEIGIAPRVTMEADDTEVIKRLVESGFGSSILPEFALRGGTRFFQTYRVAGKRLVRKQALAMAKTEYPRALTLSIARLLQTEIRDRHS